jgi:transposase
MRLGFNGLYALAAGQLRQDPQSGHLFLFANKRRDRMKILFFDGNEPLGMRAPHGARAVALASMCR